MEAYRPADVLRVAAAAGVLLLRCGAEVARVEDTVARVVRAYGVAEPEIFATPTGLFVGIADESTVVKRVGQRTIALDRVSAINALSRRLAASPMPPAEALAEIRAIDRQPGPLPGWLDVPASALAAAACTILVGGSLPELLPALLANLGVQAGERFTRWLRLPEALSDLIAGGNAVAFALLMNAWLGVRVAPVVAGGIMILVPGILFTSAVRDAISGDLVSATARGLEAFLKAAAIAVGVAGALYLFGGGQLL